MVESVPDIEFLEEIRSVSSVGDSTIEPIDVGVMESTPEKDIQAPPTTSTTTTSTTKDITETSFALDVFKAIPDLDSNKDIAAKNVNGNEEVAVETTSAPYDDISKGK